MPSVAAVKKPAKVRHESVQALLNEYPGESDPKALIRRLAREKVAYAKGHLWIGPPYCPKIFASIFDIRCKEVDFDISADGRILPYPSGRLVIEFRSERLHERQRFTIFHEFAHTLFPDYYRFLPLRHLLLQDSEDVAERELETLCDIAAAEMLLPHDDFYADITGVTCLNIEVVHHLRQRYLASIDATVHRLIDLCDSTPCCAVFLTDQRGDFSGRGPLWVKYSRRNSLFKGFIQPGIVPPLTSATGRCLKGGVGFSATGRETWWLYGKPRTWLVEATKLPDVPENPDYPKVVALLFPTGHGQA